MIIFKRLTFANILSVGNQPVTVNLNDTKTTLIHGTNGSGKSTILDALTYALFNKPFRKINLPQLINSQNKKGLLTEVEFTIGKNTYVILRGMKPKRFQLTVNGEEFTKFAADKDTQQHLEQNILKLTYKSFCQVCILGSANYSPFMSLPAAARRDCVEDFLDIKVFSAMSLLAKERLRGIRDNLNLVQGDIGNVDYKIEIQQERIDEIKQKAEADTQSLKNELKQISKQLDEKRLLVTRVEEHRENVQAMYDRLAADNPQSKANEIHKMIAKLEQKIDRNIKDNLFYDNHDDCPTCRQSITEETKTKNIKRNHSDICQHTSSIEVGEKALENVQYKLRLLKQRQDYLQSLRQSLTRYTTQMNHLTDTGKCLADKLKASEKDDGALNRELGKLEVLTDDKKELDKRRDGLIVSVDEHDIVTNLLKDGGIKAQIVKKYLPVMNKFIRQYLTELDLPLHFKLDEEFNETVHSPLHQDFSYASFSEGQKARIDLALCFTWREIGKLKNSVSTNILFLDEVFSSSLDDTGKELLMKLIRYTLPDNQNILVVDHTLSENFKEKFDRCVLVSQVKGFSQYS